MGKKTSQPRPPKPTPKPEPKAKKPIFKRWWFWLIIVVIVIVIIIVAVLVTRSLSSSNEDSELTSAIEEELASEEDADDDSDDDTVYEDITYVDGDYRYWADTSAESLFKALITYDPDGAANDSETDDEFRYWESTTDDMGIVIEAHLTTDEIHSITLTIGDWAEDENQLLVVMEALTYIAAKYDIPDDAEAWTAEILEDMEGTAVSEDEEEEDDASASVDVSVQQLLLIEDMIVASYSVEDDALVVEIEAMAGFTE